MATIQHLLDKKGHQVLSISSDDTMYDAIAKMAEHNVGSLVVMDGDKLVGIITERHYARNVFLKGKSSHGTKIQEIMSTRVVCARPEQSVEEAMAVMTEKMVRHLPVVDKKKVIGVVSIGDLVKNIISDQQHTIEQLEHYIAG